MGRKRLPLVDDKCQTCGNTYQHPRHHKNRKYCSPKCGWVSADRRHRHSLALQKKECESAVVLDSKQAGWLAGILDGEGYLGLRRRKAPAMETGYTFGPVVVISMTDLATIERIVELTGFSQYEKSRTNSKWSACYIAQTCVVEILMRLLDRVLPIMVTKQRQAQILFGFCHRRRTGIPQAQQDLSDYEELRRLNARGPEHLVGEESDLQGEH